MSVLPTDCVYLATRAVLERLLAAYCSSHSVRGTRACSVLQVSA